MQRLGSSKGKGAGWPTRFLLSPLKFQTPFVHSIKSLRVTSDFPLCVFFHVFLYKTIMTSTGAITKGADALSHDPQAVRRDIFCSFQIIVEWYFQPISFAIHVMSAATLCWPPLFLSKGTFRHNLPSSLAKLKHLSSHSRVKSK